MVPPHHIKTYQIEKYDDNNLESVMSAVHFMVTTQHFVKGQMRLKCTATIFDIFKEEIESIIEEDRPRIMASGRSYDVHNYPYDPHGHGEGGYEDHNESYLTYYSAADISSSATASATLVTTYFYKNYLQQRAQQICNKFYTLLTHSTKAHQMLTTFVINLSDMIMMMIMLVTKSIWYPLTTLVMIVIMQRALAKLHEMHKSKEITQQSDYRKTRTTYEKLQNSYRRSRHRQTHSEENQQTYRHKNATSTEATTATQIASSTNRNDSTPSIVATITNTDANVSLNAHLMVFMAELLLNRC
uniref:Uncharacterized protein n=1 Tax=Glossina pallidipes TaxID=7398 RepID=A0A1A9ZH00_GLOPL